MNIHQITVFLENRSGQLAQITGSRWTRPVLIWLLLYGLMFAMLVMVVTPERYDIKTGYPAPVTIFATKDVEDTYVTEKLRNEAAAAVDYSYGSIDSTITSKVSELLTRSTII